MYNISREIEGSGRKERMAYTRSGSGYISVITALLVIALLLFAVQPFLDDPADTAGNPGHAAENQSNQQYGFFESSNSTAVHLICGQPELQDTHSRLAQELGDLPFFSAFVPGFGKYAQVFGCSPDFAPGKYLKESVIAYSLGGNAPPVS